MKHIQTFETFFARFLSEELDQTRHKAAKHIEDIETDNESDKKTEKDAQDYLDDKSDYCPRCSEHKDDCQCQEDDPWSTQNYHRVPPGKKEKSKAKQEFKTK
jgi:hypothetical protein